jgi:hypothetical protein
MKSLIALAACAAALASCSSSSTKDEDPGEFVEVRTRVDLDKFAGKDVAVEGKFGQVGNQHGTVTLQSGLVIYVPHFDMFKRGDDWHKYVGHTVRVEGKLHTEGTQVPGLTGPLIDIRHFESLDLTTE